MKVTELSKTQITELKYEILNCINGCKGEETSMEEMNKIDELISDEQVFEDYKGIEFTDDDFYCTMGTDEQYYDDNPLYD